MIQAHDRSGCSDERALKDMAENGPPFLFGSERVIEVGFKFNVGEQPFTVTRMVSREEFEARQRMLDLPVYRSPGGGCYFEAVTD